MSANEIEFNMEDGKFRISTNQLLEADTFKLKIANLETQKINFEMQLGFYQSEIKRLEQGIEDTKKAIEANNNNIKFVTEDLTKAYNFLEKNHQAALIAQIKAEVESRKKKMEEQQNPQGPEPQEVQ